MTPTRPLIERLRDMNCQHVVGGTVYCKACVDTLLEQAEQQLAAARAEIERLQGVEQSLYLEENARFAAELQAAGDKAIRQKAEQQRRACMCQTPDPVMQVDRKFYCHKCSFETGQSLPERPASQPSPSLREALTAFVERERALHDARDKGGQSVGRSPSVSPSVLKELERMLRADAALQDAGAGRPVCAKHQTPKHAHYYCLECREAGENVVIVTGRAEESHSTAPVATGAESTAALTSLRDDIRSRQRDFEDSSVWACQSDARWHAEEFAGWADRLDALLAEVDAGAARGEQATQLQRLGNIVASLAHPKGDHRENALEDEAHDIIRELYSAIAAPSPTAQPSPSLREALVKVREKDQD